MEMTSKTVREIALEIPASTKVFEELKIDYCCGGNVNLHDACEKAHVATEVVEQKIAAAAKSSLERSEFEPVAKQALSKTIELIVENHHVYTRDAIERLKPLMMKVAEKHGGSHPSLFKLQNAFAQLCDELVPHMQKEELILFPYIKNLESSGLAGIPLPPPPFGSVRNPVRMMNAEHDAAGALLKEIRELTSDFSPPADACPSFLALYFGLEELEKDLHRHIHLENNILFPSAIEAEEELLGPDI